MVEEFIESETGTAFVIAAAIVGAWRDKRVASSGPSLGIQL
jgi:hypothetical protein